MSFDSDSKPRESYERLANELSKSVFNGSKDMQAVFCTAVSQFGLMSSPWYIRAIVKIGTIILAFKGVPKEHREPCVWYSIFQKEELVEECIKSFKEHLHNGTDTDGKAKYGGFNGFELGKLSIVIIYSNSIEKRKKTMTVTNAMAQIIKEIEVTLNIWLTERRS